MSFLFRDVEAFRTVLADPPWAFDNYGMRGHGAAASVYDCMSFEGLAALPVARITAKDAICVLWCSRPALAEGLGARLLEAWGFRPVTTGFVWVKRYPSGAPYMGLGHYTRSGTEIALLGIRGSCPRAEGAADVREVVEAAVEARPVGEDGHAEVHSSKPDVHPLIERLWPELTPRVELFARRRVPGWHAWGNEAPSCDHVFGPEIGSVWKWAPAGVVHRDVKPENVLFATGGQP